MDQNFMDILRNEFNAENGSFLISLRVEMVWDKEAFSRLTAAMLQFCTLKATEETVPRWLACGFWEIPLFTRDWTAHPAWINTIQGDPTYYEKAYERLDALAFWFFTGDSFYIDAEKGYLPM